MPGSDAVRRLAGCLLCAVPAFWVMWPVLRAAPFVVPGVDVGDNAAALWNVWWFVEGTQVEGWPYWTPLLFAPIGTQLSLHTHATVHSLLAWPWTPFTSLVTAHNLAITAGLALNGVCTFLLAFRATGRVLPSVAAGLVFSLGAQVQLRVFGHINLVHAWVLPLFALALARFMEGPTSWRAFLLGTAGALVVYTDYYYAVYAVLLVMLWSAATLLSIRIRRGAPRAGVVTTTLGVLLALDLLLIAIIAVTGGTRFDLDPLAVSVRGIRNPLTVFWLLLAAWLWRRYPVGVSFGWQGGRPPARRWTASMTVAAVLALLTAPLWLALFQVIAAGDYATQSVMWRSSPPGADLLTAALGHPRHILTGDLTAAVYAALGIDVMEQSLWVGLIPVVFLAAGRAKWGRTPGARLWVLTAVVFGVLSLGPFLRIGGVDTTLPLPHAVLRYVPVFSNARIPGRAVVMVQLAVAMLSALLLARTGRRASAGILMLLALESFPARVPVQRIPGADAVDEILRTPTTAGAVAELPLGIRDGFGQDGELDHRALVHQMHHGRPLAGGFVARLAPATRRSYTETPALAELLRISTPGAPVHALDPGAAARASALGIVFLVVNRDTFMDAGPSRAALEAGGFRLLRVAGTRELYATGARGE